MEISLSWNKHKTRVCRISWKSGLSWNKHKTSVGRISRKSGLSLNKHKTRVCRISRKSGLSLNKHKTRVCRISQKSGLSWNKHKTRVGRISWKSGLSLNKHGDDGFGERDGNGGPGVVIRHLCSGSSWNRNMWAELFHVLFNDTLNTFLINSYIGVGNILIGKIRSGYLTGIDLRSTACQMGAYTTRLLRRQKYLNCRKTHS